MSAKTHAVAYNSRIHDFCLIGIINLEIDYATPMLLGIASSVFMATNNIQTTIFHRDQSQSHSFQAMRMRAGQRVPWRRRLESECYSHATRFVVYCRYKVTISIVFMRNRGTTLCILYRFVQITLTHTHAHMDSTVNIISLMPSGHVVLLGL